MAYGHRPSMIPPISRLAQLVERKTLNLVVEGSSPPVGASFAFRFFLNASRKKEFRKSKSFSESVFRSQDL